MGAETSGCLDEHRLHTQRHLAQLFFLIVCQVAVFKNHLARDAPLAAGLHDPAHLLLDVVPIAAFKLDEVHHIIDLARALFDNVDRLEHLRLDGALS